MPLVGHDTEMLWPLTDLGRSVSPAIGTRRRDVSSQPASPVSHHSPPSPDPPATAPQAVIQTVRRSPWADCVGTIGARSGLRRFTLRQTVRPPALMNRVATIGHDEGAYSDRPPMSQ